MSAQQLLDQQTREREALQPFLNEANGLLAEEYGMGAQPSLSLTPPQTPSSDSDDEQDIAWILTDAERDARDRSKLPKPALSGKRPRSEQVRVLSLHEFFEQHDIPMEVRASRCRAYAAFVKSECPPAPRKKSKK